MIPRTFPKPLSWAPLALLLGLQACLTATKEHPREHPKEHPSAPPSAGALDPAVQAFVDSLLANWGHLDMESAASLIAQDYNDAQGRNRAALLLSLDGDKNNFAAISVSIQNAYSQVQAETLATFDFNLRGSLKQGQELKMTGRAEWILAKDSQGAFKLRQARGSRLLGLSDDAKTMVLENVVLDGATKKKLTVVSGVPEPQ